MAFPFRSTCVAALLLLLLHVRPAHAATCGDGLIASSEECDDGNVSDGDGCSSACTVEPNYTCVPGFFATGVDALGMPVNRVTDVHWSWSTTLDRSTATAGWARNVSVALAVTYEEILRRRLDLDPAGTDARRALAELLASLARDEEARRAYMHLKEESN